MKPCIRLVVGCLLAVAVFPACFCQAQTYKVLYKFTGGTDGGEPNGGLALDSAGNLYGTAFNGGSAGCLGGSCGVAFELSPGSNGWDSAALHTFTGGSDGGNPESGFVFDTGGDLFGTTLMGGQPGCTDYGCGTAFELAPGSSGWVENVLYSFQGGADGFGPMAGVILDRTGNVYGTADGGTSEQGIVFELVKGANGWKDKTLYNFACDFQKGEFSGSEVVAGPTIDARGNVYGTTTYCGKYGEGAVYELVRGRHGGWNDKTLYSFRRNLNDGSNPWAGVTFDKAGNLYGATRGGGKYSDGVIFKLTPTAHGEWKETILYTFRGGTDGNEPYGTPALDAAGNLYGTTYWGGDPKCNSGYGCGTVFKLTRAKSGPWKETVLHRFIGIDGSGPMYGALALDSTRRIFGTTLLGGEGNCLDQGSGCGVVFEIAP